MTPLSTSRTPTVRRTARRHHGAAVAVTLCFLSAACGGSHGAAGGTTTAHASATTTTSGSNTTKFGTLASPCGKGDAKGATAPGVTDTNITIGYGDDAGYSAAPGLDKEMSDAMKPMIEWCNSQGGINGRQIVGNYYDAQVTQVTQAVTKACTDKVFMLVGQGWVLDDGQEKARIACKLSSIPGYSVATSFANGPGVIQPIPNPGDQVPLSAAYELAQKFPDAVKKAAFVYAKYPATQEPRDKYAAGFPDAGWQFQDCDQIYNIAGEADWKPLATNLKACGIQAVVWVASPNPNFENMLASAQQVGFDPTLWLSDTNQYDTGFATWNGQNGGAGNHVYVRMAAVPFELADQVPAVKQYLDLIKASGGTAALLGVQSTSAFLLWATAVKACGSTVTASCVLGRAAKQTDWTAGGLHAPTQPGANTTTTCGLLLQLDGSTWKKILPTKGLFDCNPKYLKTGLTTSGVTAAALNADRVATEYGTYTP